MDYGEAIENPNSKPLTHHEVQARVTQIAQTVPAGKIKVYLESLSANLS